MIMKTKYWKFETETIPKFVMLFFFQGWHSIQFGIHFDLKHMNCELHIPFGFIRIGFESVSHILEMSEKQHIVS